MQIVKKELTIQGSWTCVFAFEPTLSLLQSKEIAVTQFITNRYPFSDTKKAFDEALTDKGSRIKTVIELE